MLTRARARGRHAQQGTMRKQMRERARGRRAHGKAGVAAGGGVGGHAERWVHGEFGMADTVARDLKIKGKILIFGNTSRGRICIFFICL